MLSVQFLTNHWIALLLLAIFAGIASILEGHSRRDTTTLILKEPTAFQDGAFNTTYESYPMKPPNIFGITCRIIFVIATTLFLTGFALFIVMPQK